GWTSSGSPVPWPSCTSCTTSAPMRSSTRRWRLSSWRRAGADQRTSAVVRELERQALVVLPKQRLGLLQGVLALGRDPELVALDGGLDLELRRLDVLHQGLGLVTGDPLGQIHGDGVAPATAGARLARSDRLEAHFALDELLLEDVERGLDAF